LEVNYERLAHWFPGAFDKPPTLEGTRADLERSGQAWLEGSQLPLANLQGSAAPTESSPST
jgi:ribosomal-protein-serine acetyltransferase